MTQLDREVIRLLMYQVREEQAARLALTRALVREEAAAVPVPTDKEVEIRIQELQEVAKQNLTKRNNSGII
jgi:hypothetical protein